ncbi:MAG: hypothetical protein MK012_00985 [Dehalococcoidia bacterium]|jgi:hypothetical protein|nr:hypothetical protein [Dehalococcoidia bacterium]|tara:strand:- start:91 stop:339 length:249 start_codon:yes stop_codon:yes gene_type:complete
MKNLINGLQDAISQKSWIKTLIVNVMLLWGMGMAFSLPPIAAAAIFCSVVCPIVLIILGNNYAIPFFGLGFVWFIYSVVIYS